MNRFPFILLFILFLQLNTFAFTDSTCIAFNNLYLESEPRPENLPDKVYTNHFIIHYNASETNFDYANNVAAYAEFAYEKICIIRGWPVPPPDNARGGDDRYDIYIETSLGPLGVCIAEFDNQWQNEWAPSFIKIRNNLDELSGKLQITVAHEFNHATQFAYTYKDGYPNNFWFYENCATYIGEEIYGFGTFYYFSNFWGIDPLNNPELRIDYQGAGLALYQYAGFIWPMFLVEWTNDEDIIRIIWQRMGQNPDENIMNDIDFILSQPFYEKSLTLALKEYAIWRYFTGQRADPTSLKYSFPTAKTKDNVSYPTGNIYFDTMGGLGGTNFIVFKGNQEVLNILMNGADNIQWEAMYLKDKGYNNFTKHNFPLNSIGDGSLEIIKRDINNIVLIPVCFTPGRNSGSGFYSATVLPKRAVKFANRYLVENLGGQLLLNNSDNVNSGDMRALGYNNYSVKTINERFIENNIKKHNNWNDQLSNFFLNKNFQVTQSGNVDQYAQFENLHPVTIRNIIDGISFNDQITVWFNDPWYVKDQYDNQSGMGDFISTLSPYYPTGKYNESVGGVFLNQGYNPVNQTWAPPYYSVKTDYQQNIFLNQTGRTHKFYFQGWSASPEGSAEFQNANSTETPVVFKQANATVQAILKGTQLSGNTNGFSNSSQRKFISTLYPQYYYHLVYTSGGSVWYEKALVNNEVVQPIDWQLMNNAKPLNGDFLYTEAKSPSIDYCYATHGLTEENYFIYIVYQKKKADNKYEIRLSKFNQAGAKIFDIQVFSSEHTDYAAFDCMPVVGVSRQKDDYAPIKVVVLWRRPAEGSNTAGLYYVAGFDQGTSITWTDSYPTPLKISTTDINSTNPSLAVFKSPNGNISYHLAYQQGTSQIKYTDITFGVNGTSAETPVVISTGSGSYTNIAPSITVNNTRYTDPVFDRLDDSPKVVWCTGNDGFAVYRSKPNKFTAWSPFYIYYENDDVQSPTISGPKYYPAGTDDVFHFGWSWLEGYYKSYVSTSNLRIKKSLPYTGKNIQIANNLEEWDGFGYCVLNNLPGTPAPFIFQNKWVDYGLYKRGNIQEGRAGTIIKGEAEFYFALGDIRFNDSEIDFVNVNDSSAIINLNDLNSSLISESFEVNDNSMLNYSIFYGFNDSLLAYNSLSETDQIEFKVEIIDAQTLQVLGVHHNITQTKNDLKVLVNSSYQVNMQGIGNRTIRLRLSATNNFTSEYSLSKIYSFNQNLGKENINLIKWNGSDAITEYALEQNYPNPFNPTTKIRYSIPSNVKGQKSNVILKVYDILGNEVATLVNEPKEPGYYEVEFSIGSFGNASELASGVYIYRLKAGNFVASRKMMLIK